MTPRIAFAGDRRLAVDILGFIQAQGVSPELLLISDQTRATHGDELRTLAGLPDDRVLVGSEFREEHGISALREAGLHYIICVHFPYLVPSEVLAIPTVGCLNVHPALLPHNRGWHTPSWAILDGSPMGATIHFMDEGLDTGDIVAQVEIEVGPGATADSLYARVLDLERDLFEQAWPGIASLSPPRTPQRAGGTAHHRRDLHDESVQRLDLDQTQAIGETLRRLRGLTTNRIDEAAYYEVDGVRYRVRVEIAEDNS